MPRPQKCRRVCALPRCAGFQPLERGEEREAVVMTVDEYEAVRLMDHQGLTQAQCARQMGIARTTVTAIYDSARRKLAQTLVEGRRLMVAGGSYRVCPGAEESCPGRRGCCPRRNMKGDGNNMKLAVTYENGSVFQHFGHTSQFKLYQVESGAVVESHVEDTLGAGHGALAGFLGERGVEALICGGIGPGAQTALAQAGIRVYAGVSGDADRAVQALLEGRLEYQQDVTCDHHGHDHGHDCGHGEHQCGSHRCEH